MTSIDWILLIGTLLFIVVYGVYKNRNDKNIDGYLLGNQSLPWYHVGLSVMATQASAITFLSAPGQGFTDGMRFVQFYFGLPLAMVVLCITFIPIFHRLKVYTAYEFLENRFDARLRVFTAFLFLIQRGLSTGISIYAPSIILSTILGWDIFWTNMLMGGIVLTYTVIGGTKAISHTHLQQMFIVTGAMLLAGVLVVKMLPQDIGFVDALRIAGKSGRTKALSFEFNPQDRYNIWSGLLGGFFLQLSYFGTDQSQVGRYLTGQSITQSRLGLIMNALLKIPMQFLILMLGVLVFVFYQFNSSPIFFNKVETDKLEKSAYSQEFKQLEIQHQQNENQRKIAVINLHKGIDENNQEEISKAQNSIQHADNEGKAIKKEVSALIKKNNPTGDANDVNYIFLRFIIDHLPHGLIGLLIAVIFSASMGSIASAYSSLAATSLIDIYKKAKNEKLTEKQELRTTKVLTIVWGIFCIIVAQFAHRLGSSMIELVNILGSWFYGVILGIFLVAFYFKKIGAKATFIAAIIAQFLVILTWNYDVVAYLWLNPIGCLLVIGLAWIIQKTQK